jgi:hypothetical protein
MVPLLISFRALPAGKVPVSSAARLVELDPMIGGLEQDFHQP